MGQYFNQPSMAAGEIGPELYGRVDQELYYIGLRKVRNFIIRQFGGASNRPGGSRTALARYPDKKFRLIDFQFNEVQTYAIEFGDQYIRIIANGAQIIEASVAISAITQANPGVVTANSHGFSNGDDVYLSGILGMDDLSGRTVRVKNVTTNTFEITDFRGTNINTTGFPAYTSGGTAARIYTVSAPWLEADLFNLNYAQSADVLTVVHPTYPIKDITRTGSTSWTITDFNPQEGPFKDINITATTMYASAASGSGITITASTSVFTSGDVGSLLYIEQNSTDATKAWDVQKGIRQSEIRRAGYNYYQAPTSGSVSKNITAITAASPPIVTSAAHGLSNGQPIYIAGVGGMTEINTKFFLVSRVTTNTFSLQTLAGNDYSTSGFTAYTAGGTAETCWATGTLKPDHIEGSQVDGDPGVPWTYLHSGFGIVKITAQGGTTATVDVIKRLPDNLVGAGGASLNWAKAAWSTTQGYPSACAYHKQRFWAGGTTMEPNRLDISGTGARTFFGRGKPVLDDESLSLSLDTTQVNAIRHLISLKQLIVLTSSSEQLINGKDNTILATNPPTADVQGYNGSSRVKPIIIGNTGVYVEDAGDVVRSLQYDLTSDAFTGIDLTARSPHLFRGKKIIDWGYQKRPLSVIWAVQDDGSLLGFTFMQEQKVYAWHRHDTDGIYETVCCIPEGDETAAYFGVKRTINGQVFRFIERAASRYFDDIVDANFVDCGLSYDGRNYTATTIIITGGTSWDTPEVLTLTASSGIFKATDVNDGQIQFINGNVIYRLDISAYTSATVVSAIPTKALPVDYQGVARTDWQFARKTFKNMWHLEGKALACFADGATMPGLSVSGGKTTLERPGAVVHLGLGYTSEIETLDMAQPGGQTKARTSNVPRVFLTVQESRQIYVAANAYGDTGDMEADGFYQAIRRNPDLGYDLPIPAATDLYEVVLDSAWSKTGRVCIRQNSPEPVTINCITAENLFGSS